MRKPVSTILFVLSGFVCSSRASLWDMEGSGFDPDTSGSGSGEGPHGNINSINYHINSQTLAVKTEDGSQKTPKNHLDFTFDISQLYTKDTVMLVGKSQSFWDNKEIVAGVITGGVVGVCLAAMVMAILIYRWHRKDEEGYILGRSRVSDEYR